MVGLAAGLAQVAHAQNVVFPPNGQPETARYWMAYVEAFTTKAYGEAGAIRFNWELDENAKATRFSIASKLPAAPKHIADYFASILRCTGSADGGTITLSPGDGGLLADIGEKTWAVAESRLGAVPAGTLNGMLETIVARSRLLDPMGKGVSVVSPVLPNSQVRELHDMSIEEGLKFVANQAGCELRYAGNAFAISPPIPAAGQARTTRPPDSGEDSSGDGAIKALITAAAVGAAAIVVGALLQGDSNGSGSSVDSDEQYRQNNFGLSPEQVEAENARMQKIWLRESE